MGILSGQEGSTPQQRGSRPRPRGRAGEEQGGAKRANTNNNMGKDYYAVLGCTKDAAEKEIKKAYKVALLQTPYTLNTKI